MNASSEARSATRTAVPTGNASLYGMGSLTFPSSPFAVSLGTQRVTVQVDRWGPVPTVNGMKPHFCAVIGNCSGMITEPDCRPWVTDRLTPYREVASKFLSEAPPRHVETVAIRVHPHCRSPGGQPQPDLSPSRPDFSGSTQLADGDVPNLCLQIGKSGGPTNASRLPCRSIHGTATAMIGENILCTTRCGSA